MTSRQPYWCTKAMKQRPCWCTKKILWGLEIFLMYKPSFVPRNLHSCWPRERKRSIRKRPIRTSNERVCFYAIHSNKIQLLCLVQRPLEWGICKTICPNLVKKRPKKYFHVPYHRNHHVKNNLVLTSFTGLIKYFHGKHLEASCIIIINHFCHLHSIS